MFKVTKRMEISAMHRLNLDYESPCANIHGHNWIVWVTIQGLYLNKNGMLVDFAKLKQLIHGKMDHSNLNEVFDFNPTAEHICEWIRETVQDYLNNHADDYKNKPEERPWTPHCKKVIVMESENNVAEWSL